MAYDFNDDLTAERLRSVLSYDAEAGVFTWLVRASTRRPVGSMAGHTTRAGYISIAIDGKYFFAHRLAWLYVHGQWPAGEIDHVNRVRSDNRITNLREATRSINNRNNGGRGYHVNKYGRFIASMTVNKRSVYLGTFERAEDARAAYLSARQSIIGDLGGCS